MASHEKFSTISKVYRCCCDEIVDNFHDFVSECVTVPSLIETICELQQWRERVAPPELMGGSSRSVLTLKQTSQILEQIGTGAEARATSGSSAICHTCEGKQIKSAAEPDKRRIDSGGRPRERNPAEVRRQDLEQDTETETHTSESLTMWLRQMQQRRGEGQRKALSCLTQNKSERKTPCEPRRGWRRLRRMQ